MPQMTNVNAIKIYNKIAKVFGTVDAEEFAAKLSLSKSADYLCKFKWAKDVCNYLDGKYTPEEIKELRMSCSCHPGDNEKANTKRIFDKAGSLDEFCEAYNREYARQHPVWHEGETIFFSYPTCYCSCVKRVSETLPLTWCLCSLGYTKDLFDYVLSCDSEVELIESIKLGDSRCVMKITRANLNS